MWVRSQNKQVLINCNDFSITKQYDNNNDPLGCYIRGNQGCKLGWYENEAKAIKVLDMIAKQIEDNTKPRDIKLLKNKNINASSGIFQMPLNCEVKEEA